MRSVESDALADVFRFLAFIVGLDNPTSSTITREVLEWRPEHPGLLDDIAEGHYFADRDNSASV